MSDALILGLLGFAFLTLSCAWAVYGQGQIEKGVCIFFAAFSYPLALIKWFIEPHLNFWDGAKELILSMLPVINFFYGLSLLESVAESLLWWLI